MVDLNIHLPESFFQEEERDGYLVSSEMKKLWAVQLDLLNEFDRVCKKHNLKYILDFGSLLGAVRHKGFIPWDDDLDISMLREDYDKLMQIGPAEFRHPYFLQSQKTEKDYDGSVAKLRRSDTCYIIDNEKNLVRNKYNQGIFIDIFVFDNMPSTDEETVKAVTQRTLDAYYHIYVLAHRPAFSDGFKLPLKLIRYYYFKAKYGSVQKEYNRLEQSAKSNRETGIVGTIMYYCPHCRPLSVYSEYIEIPFENMMLPVPKDYDQVLRLRYGDYMTPVRGGAWHSLAFFDTDRSYKEIIIEKMKSN